MKLRNKCKRKQIDFHEFYYKMFNRVSVQVETRSKKFRLWEEVRRFFNGLPNGN